MANIFGDLAGTAVLKSGCTFGTAISATGAQTGVDMVDCLGNMVTALLTSSAVDSSGIFTGKVQGSHDNSTYADITGGGFTATSTATDQQILSFQCNYRYIRMYFTKTSGTSVTFQVSFIGQRRVTPSNYGGFNTTGAASNS